MINFKHNEKTKIELEKFYKEATKMVNKYNKEKNKLLEDFLLEIYENRGRSFDVKYEFESRIMPKIAGFGGKISGQTRAVRREIVKYILECLIDNNKEYFSKFTTMNFIKFSQHFLNVAPTKSTILPMIDNTISWKIKNLNNPDFVRSGFFNSHLKELKINQEDQDWRAFFEDEYYKFQTTVSDQNGEARDAFVILKNDIKKMMGKP